LNSKKKEADGKMGQRERPTGRGEKRPVRGKKNVAVKKRRIKRKMANTSVRSGRKEN